MSDSQLNASLNEDEINEYEYSDDEELTEEMHTIISVSHDWTVERALASFRSIDVVQKHVLNKYNETIYVIRNNSQSQSTAATTATTTQQQQQQQSASVVVNVDDDQESDDESREAAEEGLLQSEGGSKQKKKQKKKKKKANRQSKTTGSSSNAAEDSQNRDTVLSLAVGATPAATEIIGLVSLIDLVCCADPANTLVSALMMEMDNDNESQSEMSRSKLLQTVRKKRHALRRPRERRSRNSQRANTTVDDATDEEADYWAAPFFPTLRKRVTWLLIMFVGEMLTGTVLRSFQEILEKSIALTFFVPLLIGTGGNAGAQTVTTVIRAMALHQIVPRDVLRVVTKEALLGICMGIVLSFVSFIRAILWDTKFAVTLTVVSSVPIIVLFAAVVGAVIPIGSRLLKLDPALLSAPLITTVVDTTGLLIYCFLAVMFIRD